jgi:hypothetical protein
LYRIVLAWRAVGRTFGAWFSPVLTLAGFVVLRAVIGVGMRLDPWLFPALRRTPLRAPIVIVGNPRTGTTFLHRFLVEHGVGAGLQLWQALYPSLTVQRLLRPLLPWLEKISPARHHATAAHDTSLTSVETDDVAILFRYFDGFFLYGFLLAFDEVEHKLYFDPCIRDVSVRDFAWLRAVWHRSQVGAGRDRVVAKLFSLGPRAPEFLSAWHDAQIVYMQRDPVEVIPSALSLVTGVLDKRFGFWKLPAEVRQRYLSRLYAALVELLKRWHRDFASGAIPAERVFVVHYDEMMTDFAGVMTRLLAFLGHKPDATLIEAIQQTADRQRKFRSGHRYDLEQFGLTIEQIRRDTTFLNAPQPPTAAEALSA